MLKACSLNTLKIHVDVMFSYIKIKREFNLLEMIVKKKMLLCILKYWGSNSEGNIFWNKNYAEIIAGKISSYLTIELKFSHEYSSSKWWFRIGPKFPFIMKHF